MHKPSAGWNKRRTHNASPPLPDSQVIGHMRQIEQITQLARDFLGPILAAIWPPFLKQEINERIVLKPEFSLCAKLFRQESGVIWDCNNTKHLWHPIC